MKRNFTLAELILIAVTLFLSLGLCVHALHAQGSKQSYACLDNLKRIGCAVQAYAADNNDRCPTLNRGTWNNSAMWYGMIAGYMQIQVGDDPGGIPALACPEDTVGKTLSASTVSYGYNNGYYNGTLASRGGTWGAGSKLSTVKRPSVTLLAADRGTAQAKENRPEGEISYSAKDGSAPGNRHGGGASCVFPDGHGEIIAKTTLLYVTDPWKTPVNKYFGYSFCKEE